MGNILAKIVPNVQSPPVSMEMMKPTTTNISTPNMLKERCMAATLFAFNPLLNAARTATTHEPMFEPIVMYMPCSRLMRP